MAIGKRIKLKTMPCGTSFSKLRGVRHYVTNAYGEALIGEKIFYKVEKTTSNVSRMECFSKFHIAV